MSQNKQLVQKHHKPRSLLPLACGSAIACGNTAARMNGKENVTQLIQYCLSIIDAEEGMRTFWAVCYMGANAARPWSRMQSSWPSSLIRRFTLKASLMPSTISPCWPSSPQVSNGVVVVSSDLGQAMRCSERLVVHVPTRVFCVLMMAPQCIRVSLQRRLIYKRWMNERCINVQVHQQVSQKSELE
jgi:hypothetical protein